MSETNGSRPFGELTALMNRLPADFSDHMDCEDCSRGKETSVEGRVALIELDAFGVKVRRYCPRCGHSWRSLYTFEEELND